ncbi:MAG: rRNA maturation RNase YbeY [Lachnospiraceae bacterium]|nr:rRNA maturation RNase YbeY [Lachnospiraceae bacterium]
MELFFDNDTDTVFDFDCEDVAKKVINAVLKSEGCPFDTEVNLLITDNEGIREYNKNMRNIDSPTDVLSFPGLDFETPGIYEITDDEADHIDPETGLIILGDIIISADRVLSQAKEYGHSILREFAFLTAHSMLHLSGYDHMSEEEAAVMEKKQEDILKGLGINRE